MRFLPAGSSGITWATPPTSKSLALIGRSPGSVTKRVPVFQLVSFKAFPGSGPKSRSKRIAGKPARPAAAANVRLISGRLPRPATSAPTLAALTNSSRSESSERIS